MVETCANYKQLPRQAQLHFHTDFSCNMFIGGCSFPERDLSLGLQRIQPASSDKLVQEGSVATKSHQSSNHSMIQFRTCNLLPKPLSTCNWTAQPVQYAVPNDDIFARFCKQVHPRFRQQKSIQTKGSDGERCEFELAAWGNVNVTFICIVNPLAQVLTSAMTSG